MLNIKENVFLKCGRVKYEDEHGNELLVLAERDGSKIKAKIRPKDKNVEFETIELLFPYECEGIHFKSNAEDINIYYPLMKDVLEKIETWIIIMRNIRTISSCDLNMLGSILPEELGEEKSDRIVPYMDVLLRNLLEYEESKDFAKLYINIMNHKEPKTTINRKNVNNTKTINRNANKKHIPEQ